MAISGFNELSGLINKFGNQDLLTDICTYVISLSCFIRIPDIAESYS